MDNVIYHRLNALSSHNKYVIHDNLTEKYGN